MATPTRDAALTTIYPTQPLSFPIPPRATVELTSEAMHVHWKVPVESIFGGAPKVVGEVPVERVVCETETSASPPARRERQNLAPITPISTTVALASEPSQIHREIPELLRTRWRRHSPLRQHSRASRGAGGFPRRSRRSRRPSEEARQTYDYLGLFSARDHAAPATLTARVRRERVLRHPRGLPSREQGVEPPGQRRALARRSHSEGLVE
ncbi:hypothetical protein BDK51DRAFT_37861 [Blyttiomyces helicus]|uniref:Uncharacterized protein n=1 Tax=Blyttiomyces helicus TaxID=388810 RepID=A0A4P9WC87_9FUNG|nr:hypothetical protein BDK51DRAFT_37861 [Blyttiomyces helicus]|eukprot:RKO89255.1 hypothetical protein BDK51DRAFT_37861 [Blyttiomyces helicus]